MSATDMPDRFEPLSAKSLNLLHADYTHGIERTLEANPTLDDFDYQIPRAVLINEIKRMEAWIQEHDLNGASAHPENEA